MIDRSSERSIERASSTARARHRTTAVARRWVRSFTRATRECVSMRTLSTVDDVKARTMRASV